VTYAIETLPTYENDDLNLIESAWKAAGWQPDGFYAAAGNSDIHGWRSLGGYNVNASIIGQQLTVHASTPCVNDTTFASSVDSDLPETIRG
jgi:hypothetical protein